MNPVVAFLSQIFSYVLTTVGTNDLTLGMAISGALIIGLAMSVFKKLKV